MKALLDAEPREWNLTTHQPNPSRPSASGAAASNLPQGLDELREIAARMGDRLVLIPEKLDEPDYAAVDRIVPHPVYARQRWISILNPGEATFRDVVMPLLTEAHDQLAAARARHAHPTA